MCRLRPQVTAFCVVAATLFLRATAGQAATPLLRADEGPQGKALYFWDVDWSWPGREQADARLDQSVRAWHAAIPVAELLAALEQQTGVHLACWPAGDDNERIRVTVYLNPEQPPSLRDVMAQLSWVLDCSFACTGDGGPRSYYLLRSSLGDGVLKRLAKEAQQTLEAMLAEGERQKREAPGLIRAKLEDYRQALALSPAALAKQYPTRLPFGWENAADGYLLLNMVDPAQRAATQFALSLSPADLEAVLSYQPLTRKWTDWTPEQRALLTIAFSQIKLPFGAPPIGPLPDSVTVYAAAGDLAGIVVSAERKFVYQGQEYQGPSDLITAVVRWMNGLREDQWLDISRGLGEVKTEEEAEEFNRKLAQARQDWEDECTRRWQEGLAKQGTLSPRGAATLSSLLFTLPRFTEYPGWLLQEAVARQSGMNLIADCFYERYRHIQTQAAEDPEFWKGEKEARVSALQTLGQVCQSYPLGPGLVSTGGDGQVHVNMADADQLMGWEWGDAGTFLRFRSVHRDVWRGSLLPRDFLDRLDRAVEPTLVSLMEGGERPAVVRLPFDLVTYRDLGRLMAQLEPLPYALGGMGLYDDPSQQLGRLRHAFRDLALRVLRADNFDTGLYRFVATLSDDQLVRLQDGGLGWSRDLDDSQQAWLEQQVGYAKEKGLQEQEVPELVLRVRPLLTVTEEDAREPYSYLHLQLMLKDKIVFDTSLGLDGIRTRDLPSVPELQASATQPDTATPPQ